MNNNDKAHELIDLVGSVDNINSVVNCMTRVRFDLKDYSKVDESKLKKLDYVLGVQQVEGQYQIIVGPGNAGKIVAEINEDGMLDEATPDSSATLTDEEIQANKAKYKKEVKASGFVKKIGQVFLPMIPGFIAAGLFLGIANIIINIDVSNLIDTGLSADAAKEAALATAGPVYWFCQSMGIALYGFLTIFTGIYTARAYGGTEILGGILAAFTVSATLPQIVQSTVATISGTPTFSPEFLEFTEKLPSFGGVFGALFAVIFMSYVEKKLHKVIPGIIDLIVTPLLTLIIAGIGAFVLIIFAGYLTELISLILNFLVNTNGILSAISGAIIAGTFLPLVLLGLHQGLTPIYINEIVEQGYTLILPIAAMAGAGQVGAAISIFFQARKQKDKSAEEKVTGAIVPGILGVGEPLIYGVTLPLGKPFITAGLGAAVGGAWISVVQVGAVATGPSGVTLIPLILPQDIIQYIIGLLLAYTFGFIFTQLLFKYQRGGLDV